MTIFDIVYVPFPFSDLSASKKRPCLVLAKCKPRSYPEQLIVAMITSKTSNLNFPHDVVIDDLKSAGLPVASVIRMTKVVTLDSKLVIKKLGQLGVKEKKLATAEFGKLFKGLVK